MRDSADTIEQHVRANINPPNGLSLEDLREAGYPLAASGFRPGAAGLDKPYQIINQSGGLNAILGTDPIASRPTAGEAQTFVGFDDSGSSSTTRHPFGDPAADASRRSVDWDSLLNWLLNGTATLQGRPVLINSLVDADPELLNNVEQLLRRIKDLLATIRTLDTGLYLWLLNDLVVYYPNKVSSH